MFCCWKDERWTGQLAAPVLEITVLDSLLPNYIFFGQDFAPGTSVTTYFSILVELRAKALECAST